MGDEICGASGVEPRHGVSRCDAPQGVTAVDSDARRRQIRGGGRRSGTDGCGGERDRGQAQDSRTRRERVAVCEASGRWHDGWQRVRLCST